MQRPGSAGEPSMVKGSEAALTSVQRRHPGKLERAHMDRWLLQCMSTQVAYRIPLRPSRDCKTSLDGMVERAV